MRLKHTERFAEETKVYGRVQLALNSRDIVRPTH